MPLPRTVSGWLRPIAVAHTLSIAMTLANTVEHIEKLTLNYPQRLRTAAGDFPIGFGSGLEFYKKNDDGSLDFYSITDRGPNYPAWDSLAIKNNRCMVSFQPDFQPAIARVHVSPDHKKADVIDTLTMTYQGKPVTGVFQNPASKSETMCDRQLQRLPDQFGLDTESIAIMRNGTFVLGDEYTTSLNLVNPTTGEIFRRFTPGDGLPSVLSKRPLNRGFEAITVAPDDTIWCMLESTLDDPNNTKKNALFIRMIQVDPTNGQSKMFAYPFDYTSYVDSSKVKIGDMLALDNKNFLVVEQGPSKTGGYHNKIYKINVDGATDISEKTLKDSELEHGVFSDLNHIHFVQKSLVVDVRTLGWTAEKLEGLAKIDDHTLAIMNDNDFGIDGIDFENAPCWHKKGSMCQQAKPVLSSVNTETHLWILRFRDAL